MAKIYSCIFPFRLSYIKTYMNWYFAKHRANVFLALSAKLELQTGRDFRPKLGLNPKI